MTDSPIPFSGAYGYEPPESLWELVQQYAPPYEHDEIKTTLGESLIDISIELHEEIRALLEIWRDYRDETENNQPQTSLPEPPAARERLKQEIRFFVESLQEKAKEQGRNPDAVLDEHNVNVLDYVLESKIGCSPTPRPGTSRSYRDGRETPLRRGTPNSDGMSLSSTISEEVEAMNEKLNILRLDEVVQHLRETLECEVDQLKHDIQFLQDCLEEEADFRSQGSASVEPSLSELKEERTKLEKQLLTRDPINHVKNSVPVKYQSGLSPAGGVTQKKLVKPHGHSAKLEPLKVDHHIDTQNYGRQCSNIRTNQLLRNLNTTSHVTVKTSKVSHVDVKTDVGPKVDFTPSPPSSGKPSNRPSSASRFRQRVLACRET